MQDANYQAAINAGCLLWMPEIAELEYRDVMTSLLYVQLAASKRHCAFEQPEQWHEVFGGALKQFGWMPLHAAYRTQTPDADFRLADWMKAEELPLTEDQFQAGHRLAAWMATRPGADRVVQGLQRHIAKALPVAEVDARAAQAPDQHAAPTAAVAAHFGVILPERRMALLSLHFKTKEALAENVYAQRFAADKIVGGILVKVFAGQLSEITQALFREQFDTLLKDHWAKEITEQFSFQGAQS